MSRPLMPVLAASFSLVLLTTVQAGQVTIKGSHLCCAACQTRAEKALDGLKGVSKRTVDRNAKVITFTAADEKAVGIGLASLAKSGFYGKATHNKKPVAFPTSGAKKGARADTILLHGVHLCCDACVVGAQVAVQNVKGLKSIEIDREERTIRLIGTLISQSEAIAAINRGGFFARIRPPKKK
ncbi:MAG: hypothetical protein VB859_01155 [Planctomycetaceae bacterium]